MADRRRFTGDGVPVSEYPVSFVRVSAAARSGPRRPGPRGQAPAADLQPRPAACLAGPASAGRGPQRFHPNPKISQAGIANTQRPMTLHAATTQLLARPARSEAAPGRQTSVIGFEGE